MSATLRLILEDGKMVQTLKEIPTYDTGQFYETRGCNCSAIMS